MAFRYLATEHNVKTTTKKTSGLTHRRLWTYAVWIRFKRDMKILRPSLPSPWRTDHALLVHCLSLFIVCMGTTPGLALPPTGEQATTRLLHPTALGSIQRHYRVKADRGFCCRPRLHPGLALCGAGPPLLCAAVEPRQKTEERGGGAFPGQWFHFFMLNFKPNAFLWLKQDKGQQASTLPPPKPTGMKVTSHWFHAKVQSCTLAPQLHYSESQASLVSRNAFRVDLFRISRKIFYLCVFPHLRTAPGSTVGGLLVFKQLCLVPETETTLLWAHLRQHLYISEGVNPSSLLSNATAKFSFPKTEPW